ncbi:hypothetical protein GGR44_000777 [Sphingobium fontiphilum]|uniref:Uncharacterized protein n=1 Tax=Sphingobium fontiphilum TaxID=944425 RepID=A0A7W6DH18_9SPHN|nr:hypothetical protein [Sphingobium fontiphilum]MBB3981146.1 hypothetical protein [Sphingobium fontiphilum]
MSGDTQGACSLSNPGPDPLLVWLEPWVDEFEVPARSTISLHPSDGCGLGEIEWVEDRFVLWATCRTVEVFIDGALQSSGSALIPLSGGLTKGILHILFADHPAARLGGRSWHERKHASMWEWLKRLLGL